MKHVLIINQSAELYGSDKALLELIENYPSGYTPIVVLHEDGPLKCRLQQLGVKVIHSSVIKMKRGILKPQFFLKLPFETFSSIRKINKALGQTKIDLVHSNAMSVFIGAFYSFLLRKKHLWHVHEIIEHPKLLANIYPKIVSFFSDRIVFNSKSSFCQFKTIKPNIAKQSSIVYNGQKRVAPASTAAEISEIRTRLFKMSNPDAIVIGLVGRISRLKGQRLLLKAFDLLCKNHPKIHLVYIGSAPAGQEHFLDKLKEKIASRNLNERVTIVDFQENIWPIYDALDIVTVPSTEPESFGLVATEAMLSQKPVVGSRLGGLTEIIVHGETGYLFESKNEADLASKLEMLLQDPAKMKRYGRSGYERVVRQFSTESYVAGILSEYERLGR